MKSLRLLESLKAQAFKACALVLLLGGGLSIDALAQDVLNVTGKVTSNGDPVIGAAVVVKGTTSGTVTDVDGTYSIKAPSNGTLTVTSIGYQDAEAAVAGRQVVNINMVEEALNLDDAIVIGYGTQKKVNLIGAVSSVSTEELKGKPITNAIEGLQGTTPGLIIQQGSSAPGSAPSINIRGNNTLNDNTPLVLIDGIEGSLANINPNDIEQISVLKDASSTAIYGSRASNGVILVTTKKGQDGKVEVNYNFNYGFQQATCLPTIVDSWIYAELYNEAAVNSGRETKFTAEQIADFRNGGTNCNWVKSIYKDYATQQSHNVSVSGGTKGLSYMGSFGYVNQNSLFKGPDYGYDRYNGRINLRHQLLKNLSIGLAAQYTRNITNDHAYWTSWIIEQPNRMPPIYEIKNPDGTYNYPSGSNSNSLERLEKGGYRKSVNDDMSAVISADWEIIKGLKLSGSFGARILNNNTHENRYASEAATSGDKEDHIAESFWRSLKLTSTVTLGYNTTIASKHNIGAMVGYGYEGEHTNEFGTTRVMENHKFDVMGGSANGTEKLPVSAYSGAGDWSLYSVFARLTYNYDERYLFEFNLRNDYSSYFAKGNRSGVFPSVSAGWRLSQEKWYTGRIKDIMPSVKIRGSWGLVGNNRIGAYRYMQTISAASGMNFGGEGVSTIGFSSVDPGIKWETTRMADIGVDLGLLKNNLNISFDYFNNMTRDILVNLSVPGVFGNGAPTTNAAKVRTQGWELAVSYDFKTGIVNHRVAGNVSDSRNTVVDTKGTDLFNRNDDIVKITREGYPMGSYFALHNLGLFQSDEQAANSPHLENVVPKAGDVRYFDKKEDGVINDEDRFIVGNDFPRYSYGFSYGLEVKGFTFSFFLQGIGKRSRWMRGESVEAFHNNNEGPILDFHMDRWTPNNPNATYPRLTMGSENYNNAYKSDYWIQNAAYMRVKNIQLGYRFPKAWMNKIHFKELQVLFSCENPFTVSKMKGGWDPEYQGDNGDGSGRMYPVARVWSIGLNVKF